MTKEIFSDVDIIKIEWIDNYRRLFFERVAVFKSVHLALLLVGSWELSKTLIII